VYDGNRIAPGVHQLELVARDAAGNTRALSVGFVIDVFAPTIWHSVEDGTWYTVPQNLTVIVDDDLDPSPGTTVLLNGIAHSRSRVLEEGTYTLAIAATDWAGNAADRSLTFYVDLTSPSLSLVDVADGASYRRWVAPQLEVADSIDGSPKVDWTLNGEAYTPGEKIRDGTHTLVITATDRADHATELVVGFRVDTVAPLIDLNVAEGLVYRGPITPVIIRGHLGRPALRAGLGDRPRPPHPGREGD
jgi:hypothetical protein